MQIVRVFNDPEQNRSAMELLEIPCTRPVTEGMADSAVLPADSLFFREVTVEQKPVGWHAAPYIQIVVVLEGGLTIEAGSGDSYTFAPGQVILVEDVDGPGHRGLNLLGHRIQIQISAGVDPIAVLSGVTRPVTA